MNAGFDAKTAAQLSRGGGVQEIEDQITWLARRNIERNRLGMLRRAIEQNWPEPSTPPGNPEHTTPPRRDADENRTAVETAADADRAERRREERRSRLMRWRSLSRAERKRLHTIAINEADSQALRRLLLAHNNLTDPPSKTLDVMARTLATAVGES